jgi:hypothetical protein
VSREDLFSDKYRIADTDWDQGWRRDLRAAIDKALEPYPEGEPVKIDQIWVRKRSGNPVHDYRIDLTGG